VSRLEIETPKLIEILNQLEQKELIIHPLCKKEIYTMNIRNRFELKMENVVNEMNKYDIKVFVENNSKLDELFNKTEDIERFFKNTSGLEFILDVAHMNDYDHLRDLVSIKEPYMLHVADRNLSNIHEHIEIGKGNIDFKYVFSSILTRNDYRIIIEVPGYGEVARSKKALEQVFIRRST
jgi:sugar phosphate isomerase/epimerase